MPYSDFEPIYKYRLGDKVKRRESSFFDDDDDDNDNIDNKDENLKRDDTAIRATTSIDRIDVTNSPQAQSERTKVKSRNRIHGRSILGGFVPTIFYQFLKTFWAI